jgi:hypothetical protein
MDRSVRQPPPPTHTHTVYGFYWDCDHTSTSCDASYPRSRSKQDFKWLVPPWLMRRAPVRATRLVPELDDATEDELEYDLRVVRGERADVLEDKVHRAVEVEERQELRDQRVLELAVRPALEPVWIGAGS